MAKVARWPRSRALFRMLCSSRIAFREPSG